MGCIEEQHRLELTSNNVDEASASYYYQCHTCQCETTIITIPKRSWRADIHSIANHYSASPAGFIRHLNQLGIFAFGKGFDVTNQKEVEMETQQQACNQHSPSQWVLTSENISHDRIYKWYCPECQTLAVKEVSASILPSALIAGASPASASQHVIERNSNTIFKHNLQTQATREAEQEAFEKKNMTYTHIKTHLDTQFIQTEKIARLLALAVDGQKNCILWGEAGHAKSEMVVAAIEALGMAETAFIQSFGEGMDEARLYGGLDFAKLETEKILEYNPDRSFLNHEVAVFEELFDAPPIVLLSLKDTLTAREFRNGPQRYKMKTKSIIAITNRAPTEISEIGSAAHALVERFPLQLEVKWETYTAETYKAMFDKVKPDAPNDLRHGLAKIIKEAHDEGAFISPRTAIHALETLLLMPSANGNAVTAEAYAALMFIPGFEKVMHNIAEKLERERVVRLARESLHKCEVSLQEATGLIEHTSDPMVCLGLVKRVEPIIQELNALKIPDNLTEMRNSLKNVAQNLMNAAANKAVNLAPTNPAAIQGEAHEGRKRKSDYS